MISVFSLSRFFFLSLSFFCLFLIENEKLVYLGASNILNKYLLYISFCLFYVLLSFCLLFLESRKILYLDVKERSKLLKCSYYARSFSINYLNINVIFLYVVITVLISYGYTDMKENRTFRSKNIHDYSRSNQMPWTDQIKYIAPYVLIFFWVTILYMYHGRHWGKSVLEAAKKVIFLVARPLRTPAPPSLSGLIFLRIF